MTKTERDALVQALEQMQRWESRLKDSPVSLLSHYKRCVGHCLELLHAMPVSDAEPNTFRSHDSTTLFARDYAPPAAVPAGFVIEKWLEREAWSFLRNVLTQGQAIEMDYRNNKYESYEHLSARLDEAACERRDQLEAAIAARPDAPAGEKA